MYSKLTSPYLNHLPIWDPYRSKDTIPPTKTKSTSFWRFFIYLLSDFCLLTRMFKSSSERQPVNNKSTKVWWKGCWSINILSRGSWYKEIKDSIRFIVKYLGFLVIIDWPALNNWISPHVGMSMMNLAPAFLTVITPKWSSSLFYSLLITNLTIKSYLFLCFGHLKRLMWVTT